MTKHKFNPYNEESIESPAVKCAVVINEGLVIEAIRRDIKAFTFRINGKPI